MLINNKYHKIIVNDLQNKELISKENISKFLEKIAPGDYELDTSDDESVALNVIMNYRTQYKNDIKLILSVLDLTFPDKHAMVDFSIVKTTENKKLAKVEEKTVNMLYIDKELVLRTTKTNYSEIKELNDNKALGTNKTSRTKTT